MGLEEDCAVDEMQVALDLGCGEILLSADKGLPSICFRCCYPGYTRDLNLIRFYLYKVKQSDMQLTYVWNSDNGRRELEVPYSKQVNYLIRVLASTNCNLVANKRR